MDTEEFEGAGNAGASLTYPQQVGTSKKGGLCMLKGHPCKVVDIATAKTGKHGSAKAKLTGIDIFNGTKHEEMSPTSHNIDVPYVVRTEYTLVDIGDDNYLHLMNEAGDIKEDVKILDDEVGADIREGFNKGQTLIIGVLNAMAQEKVITSKEA